MILTAPEILKNIQSGNIVLTPFNADNLNPNSYNVTIGNELVMYKETIIDLKQKAIPQSITIPTSGLILQPGRVYLAKTQEYTETRGLVPVLYGRSSAARAGLSVQCGGGLGDTGYKGVWTLSLSVVQPVRLYPGMSIAQLVYFKTLGESVEYSGKYQGSTSAESFKLS